MSELILPQTDTLLLEHKDHALLVTLNRPEVKNAMSLQMVHELMAVFKAAATDLSIRSIVLRGAEGNFCSGGDINDMASARGALAGKQDTDTDPFYHLNREFGRLITTANASPQVVVTVLEGAVLGGGFGLACVSDVAIASQRARFGLPETGLGIPPAQIAPFVVSRIGLTQARRLALLGARIDGDEALRLGIVHYSCASEALIDSTLDDVLQQIRRCAPQANATTKALMLSVGQQPLESLLDQAARDFSASVQGAEGQEGTRAFIQKRLPAWAEG